MPKQNLSILGTAKIIVLMNQLSSFFYKQSTWLIAIALTTVTFGYLFFVMMDVAKCFEVADSSVGSLAISFGFSAEMVEQFLSIRTAEMLDCYIELNRLWDNIFALLYGFMYAAWLSVIFKPFQAKWKALNLLPFLQTVFDWIENFNLANAASAYLAETPIPSLAVQVGSYANMIKWTVSGLVFLAILVGIVLRIRSALSKNK